MVSSEAKISDTVTNEVYHLKMHDVFYHRSNLMIAGYGHSPCYAQLYFYDIATAIGYRLHKNFNQTCNYNKIREINFELESIKPFIHSNERSFSENWKSK